MVIAIAALTVILQAIFIFHLIKNNKPYWWGFIIVSFPVIGCIVYYFMEIFPDTHDAVKAEKFVGNIKKRIGSDAAFAHRMNEVEVCGSVANKLALSRDCMQRGLYDDAARLYHGCMEGLYADDPNLLLGLAEAHVEQGRCDVAQVALDKLAAKDAKFKPGEAALLRARVLEGQQAPDLQGALRIYEDLLPVYVGLEVRYRRGVLLKKLGHHDQARSALGELEDHARRHRVNHGAELAWLELAKRELI